MKKVLKTILFLCITNLAVWGQAFNKIDGDTQNLIDSTYNALLEKHNITGTSIAIVENGEIVYATGYGFQDKENNIKADANTIYRIGSCTKSFTALAVMQLQEQKKLAIEDAIQTYLTAISIKTPAGEENPIKIKDILTHSSGLPSDIMNGFVCDSPPNSDWLIQQLNNCYMAAPAGYQHSYSNMGYNLLGKLIEVASQHDYETYLEENIFKPLSMSSTFVKRGDQFKGQVSKGYDGNKPMQEALIRDESAGLIQSNVLDMCNYINMYIAKGKSNKIQILSAKSIQEMEADGIKDIVLPTGNSWGYGLYSSNYSANSPKDTVPVKIIGHGGDTWVFHSDFKYIPELNIGAIVLTNSKSGSRISSANKLLKLYLKSAHEMSIVPREKDSNPAQIEDQLCDADDIVGQYYFSGMGMQVKKAKRIKIRLAPIAKLILKPTNDSLRYQGKVVTFGFLSKAITHQEYRFVERDDKIYFKVIHMRSGEEDYVSEKSEFKKLSKLWNNRLGTYKVVGDQFACTDCPFVNFEGLELVLRIKDNLLVADIKGKSKDTAQSLKFFEVSDKSAMTVGIGRNAGETLRILENGNLFYSGFEFALKK